VSKKSTHPDFWSYLHKLLTDSQSFFTATFSSEFATKWVVKYWFSKIKLISNGLTIKHVHIFVITYSVIG